VLALPKLGCFIFTPRCCRAGAARRHQRALLAGDTTTGVSIMRMEAGLDTGRCSPCAKCKSANGETAGACMTGSHHSAASFW